MCHVKRLICSEPVMWLDGPVHFNCSPIYSNRRYKFPRIGGLHHTVPAVPRWQVQEHIWARYLHRLPSEHVLVTRKHLPGSVHWMHARVFRKQHRGMHGMPRWYIQKRIWSLCVHLVHMPGGTIQFRHGSQHSAHLLGMPFQRRDACRQHRASGMCVPSRNIPRHACAECAV